MVQASDKNSSAERPSEVTFLGMCSPTARASSSSRLPPAASARMPRRTSLAPTSWSCVFRHRKRASKIPAWKTRAVSKAPTSVTKSFAEKRSMRAMAALANDANNLVVARPTEASEVARRAMSPGRMSMSRRFTSAKTALKKLRTASDTIGLPSSPIAFGSPSAHDANVPASVVNCWLLNLGTLPARALASSSKISGLRKFSTACIRTTSSELWTGMSLGSMASASFLSS
mmetsp:Transcript_95477/g.269995  ORF Transcript_95477/g.269995 Transcript_95477/m.269995 type:complete len:230 (+) Transcript_95477:597-1286(+)